MPIVAAKAGFPVAGRAGIIGTIIIAATVAVAVTATVREVIVTVTAAGVQAER
jgi:hypothetical protein